MPPKITDFKAHIIKNSHPEPNTGCWIWLGANSGRSLYGAIYIEDLPRKAHRVSYEAFIGKIPKGFLVCHKCDVKACVNPAHLYAGTVQQNNLDALVRNRLKTKITRDQVLKIRGDYKTKRETHEIISHRYSISRRMITRILAGERWAHLS